MKVTLQVLKDCQAIGKRIFLYGAGGCGQLVFRLLTTLGIRADGFLDHSKEKHGMPIFQGVYCYNPVDILAKNSCILFICIKRPMYLQLCQEAEEYGFRDFAHLNDLIDDIIAHYHHFIPSILSLLYDEQKLDFFYNNISVFEEYHKQGLVPISTTERIAVYTSIFGNYDELKEPKVFPENIDYFCISDTLPRDKKHYQWIDGNSFIPKHIHSPTARNRYVKMHPHKLFPQYKYSIYVDGNVEILQDISGFVQPSKSSIAVFRHYLRDCIYYEGMQVVNYKRIDAELVARQMMRYIAQGMPMHYGLAEMTAIGREHHNSLCIKLMEEWWEEFSKDFSRDQLSFMYVLWKNGLRISDFHALGNDIRKDSRVKIHCHKGYETEK